MKAQSELAGDCKSAAEMTAPRAPRGVTAWIKEAKKLDLDAIGSALSYSNGCDDLTSMVAAVGNTRVSSFENVSEVNLASPGGDAGKTTPQIR